MSAERERLGKIKHHMRIIRGAEFDQLHNRRWQDAEEEIQESLTSIENLLDDVGDVVPR